MGRPRCCLAMRGRKGSLRWRCFDKRSIRLSRSWLWLEERSCRGWELVEDPIRCRISLLHIDHKLRKGLISQEKHSRNQIYSSPENSFAVPNL